MNEILSQSFASALTLYNAGGELRVKDLELGARLRYADPRMIRKLIKEHAENLRKFNVLYAAEITPGGLGGRPATEYYLDRRQAIFICMKSGTDSAIDVQTDIVRVYDQYLAGRSTPTTFLEAMEAVVEIEKARLVLEAKNKALETDNSLLNTIIDNEFGYCSILRASQHLRVSEKEFSWHLLKKQTLAMGLEVKKVPSPRYEYQNLYPIAAFEHCYPRYDFSGLQPEQVAGRAMKLLSGQLLTATH